MLLVITKGHPAALLHADGRGGDLMIPGGVAGFVAYTLGARRFTGFSTPAVHDITAIAPQLAFIAGAGAIVAVFAWNEGIRRLGPADGSLFINLVPLVGANLAARDRQAIVRPSRLACAATRVANAAKSLP